MHINVIVTTVPTILDNRELIIGTLIDIGGIEQADIGLYAYYSSMSTP